MADKIKQGPFMLDVTVFYMLFALAAYVIGKWVMKRAVHAKNALKKKKATDDHKDFVRLQLKDFKLAPEMEEALPRSTIKEIHQFLLDGKVSCLQLVKFYSKLALDRTEGLNYICDLFYEDATALANQRDQELLEYKSTTRVLPPLFGIPVSLKDVIEYKGR